MTAAQVRGARLTYAETGLGGVPFVFQHGMGGEVSQPLGYLGLDAPARVVSVNARGHGGSSDLDPGSATFDAFADDVIAVADELGLDRFVAGGISMGAGTALNLAVRFPDRVSGLVLCRPAWLDRPQAGFNQQAYAELADLLDRVGPAAAADYPDSDTYRTVHAESPAAAASLLGQLTRPRAAENSVLLRALPATSPTTSAELWRSLDVPTLVIGHRDDPFHPYEIAAAHAEAIPGATLVTVPSKDADPAGFAGQIRTALHDVLRKWT